MGGDALQRGQRSPPNRFAAIPFDPANLAREQEIIQWHPTNSAASGAKITLIKRGGGGLRAATHASWTDRTRR